MRKRLRGTGNFAALGASATLALGITTHLHATGPARHIAGRYVSAATQQHAAAKADTGLVIVPFAVPVAVPVATVQQPSVLYSYKQYAGGSLAENAGSIAPSPPAPLPQGEKQVRRIRRRHPTRRRCSRGIAPVAIAARRHRAR